MIARADTPARAAQFDLACRGVPCLEALLPLERALFGPSQPGRFYTGPGLALDVGGPEALAACRPGGSPDPPDPEELAAFLAFCGCGALVCGGGGARPAGWRLAETLPCFALAAGASLPQPPADEELWAALTLEEDPSPSALARFLYPAGGLPRDDYYSALCTKRSRGLARAWALKDAAGQLVCTVGAYAIRDGQAYLACGCTAPALRGRGAGGRLIAAAAGALAAEGLRVCLYCREERAAFYTRLGFAPAGALARCLPPDAAGKK